MSLLKSTGLKRRLSSALNALVLVLSAIPSAAPALNIIKLISGVLGGVGVAHAAVSGSIGKSYSGTLSALLAAILLYASSNSYLAPFVPVLQSLAGILGVAAVTSKN